MPTATDAAPRSKAPSADAAYLLQVDDLTVEIATPGSTARILEGVGFELDRAERLGIVGESGCGKSMTALALVGLLPARATARGRIRLQGEDLLPPDEARLRRVRGRRIAMVFQEPMSALNPVQTIGAQVAEGMRWHFGLARAEAEARAVWLLDRVGLPRSRFSPQLLPHQLSGGQRQRVVLAIALACEPEILIADEPTSALDVTVQAQILDLIGEVVDQDAMALIMISHDLGVIAKTTDRLLVMYAGRVVERGPTAAIFERLAHPYTRGLFAALPQRALVDIDGRRARLPTLPGSVLDPTERPPGCPFAPRCPRVTPECRGGFPDDAVVDAGHRVACLHPHGRL